MMIHDFDMANFPMGGTPAAAHAVGSSLIDDETGAAGDVDAAAATLIYRDGRIGVILNSRRAVCGYDQRGEVLGSDGLSRAETMLENTVVISTAAGDVGAKQQHFFPKSDMAAQEAERATFVAATEAGAAPPVSLADGVAALAMAGAMAGAATRSAAAGAPVDIEDLM